MLKAWTSRGAYLGACLGAATWVSGQFILSLAEATLVVSHAAADQGSQGKQEAGRMQDKPAASTADATPAVQQSAQQQQQRHNSPPDTLREGVHFAVLSGADGSSSKLRAVAAAMCEADVVLLGEFHDDAVAHALQLALLRNVAAQLGHIPAPQPQQQTPQQQNQQKQPPQQQHQQQQEQQQQRPLRPLILSLEMFERDVEPVLSEYLAGHIPLSDLLKDARPWSNYTHDYHMLVDLCKQLKLPVVAANAPRRYVSLAGRAGSKALLSLPAAARQWLPPLPHAPSSEAYVHKVQRNMRQAAAGMEALRQEQQQQQGRGSTALSGTAAATQQEQPALQQEQDSAGCPYIGVTVSSNFLAAQSLWDATMAYAISQALQQQPAGQQQQQHQQESGLLDLASPQQPVTPTLGHHTAAQATAGAVSAQPAGGNTTAMPAPATDAAPASLLQQHQHQHQRQQLEGVGGSSATQLPPGPLVVHVCGKFHCEDRLGIPEHLAAYAPGARVLVVVFSPADSMEAPRDGAVVGSADFVVLTDSKLPRSFEVEHPV